MGVQLLRAAAVKIVWLLGGWLVDSRSYWRREACLEQLIREIP